MLSSNPLYPYLDVGLPAFHHEPELLGGPFREGKDNPSIHRIGQERRRSRRLNVDRHVAVNAREASSHRLYILRCEIHGHHSAAMVGSVQTASLSNWLLTGLIRRQSEMAEPLRHPKDTGAE